MAGPLFRGLSATSLDNSNYCNKKCFQRFSFTCEIDIPSRSNRSRGLRNDNIGLHSIGRNSTFVRLNSRNNKQILEWNSVCNISTS